MESAGFDLRCDVTRFLLEGIAQQDGFTFEKRQRLEQVMLFLETLWDDKSDASLASIVERADSRGGDELR